MPAVIAPDLCTELALTSGQLSGLPAAIFLGAVPVFMGIIVLLSRWVALVEDKVLRQKIFSRSRDERRASIDALLRISGNDKLLQGNPLLERSIQNRFSYLDPLNHIQVEMLKWHRQNFGDPKVLRGIQLTINGISVGLRNGG